MIKDKYDEILNEFCRYYTYLYDHVVDWWPSGRASITVKLDDGILMEFDTYEKTIRRIQPNNYMKDTSELRREIGRNIQKAISNRGLSQSEIAERCGITEAMLSRYIHGTSTPGVDKIYKLAAVLSCRVVDIMGEAYED